MKLTKSNNFIILLAAFLIIGLVGAYYFWQQAANKDGETLSDRVEDIERDLKEMKFDDLETEIGDIQKELQQ